MKRRKKYNPKKHCEQMMQGARLIYDGNYEEKIDAFDRYGRRLQPFEYNAMIDRPWRWHLYLTVIFKRGDLERFIYREFVPEGLHRLSDLSGLIDDTRTEAGLEMPEYKIAGIEWTAKIV